MNLSKLINTILDEKRVMSGIAIILIFFCHLVVADPELVKQYSFLKVFAPGFIGVDIFLFYSGYTLGFSLENRGVVEFYKKRLKRIYPMFVIFALLSTFVFLLKGLHFSLFDWFCNITTLSYYHVGGVAIDWYLSSIFLFYLAYPAITKSIDCFGLGGLFFVLLFIFLLTSQIDFYEYYGCAISRIPIFYLGAYIYKLKKANKRLTRNFIIAAISFIIIFIH